MILSSLFVYVVRLDEITERFQCLRVAVLHYSAQFGTSSSCLISITVRCLPTYSKALVCSFIHFTNIY